jgi:hypothetical protein
VFECVLYAVYGIWVYLCVTFNIYNIFN